MKLNLKSRLLVLSIVPALFILMLSYIILSEIFNDKKNLEQTKHHIVEANAISGVIHFMQIERGLTAGIIAGGNINNKNDALLLARENLDKAIDDAKAVIFSYMHKNNNPIVNILTEIQSNRKNIDFTTLSLLEAKSFYTKKIAILLDEVKTIPSMMNDKENRNYVQAYTYLSSSKEYLAQNRAVMMEVFTLNKLLGETFILIKENLKVCNINKQNFKIIAPKDILDFYNSHFKGEAVEETFKIVDMALAHSGSTDFYIDPSYWFQKSTETINLLKDTENELFRSVTELIDKKLDLIFYKITILSSFLLLSFITLVILMTQIVRKILLSTNTLEQKYSDSVSILEQYKMAVDRSFIVSKTDSKGVITYVNDEFCRTSGYLQHELLGKPHNIIRHPDMPKEAFEEMWYTIKELKQPWSGEVKNRKKNGSYYWVKAIINPIIDNDGNVVEYIGVRADITEIKDALITDSLTGYENRFKLNSDIQELTKPCLAIINLDDFRQINDLYGHKFGDLVIISIANKIYNFVSKDKNLKFYRLQGDEFVILAVDYDEDIFVAKIKDILNAIKEKFSIQNEDLLISCCCGVSFEESEYLLSSANMALKIAKKENRDILVYNKSLSLNCEYENNINVTKKLSSALREGNVVTYYQPIVNNSNLAYEKYECLVRIIDGNTVISPFLFLDIAKKTRQYFDITKTVIYQSFEMFKERDVEFSINLSIKDILEAQIYEYILMMLQKYNIGSKVVFEIVESEYIDNFEGVMNFINSVKKYNCKIAIDDFGTGYSNFEYLIKLQADYLKIDGSLIKNIDKDKNSFLVVSTIVEFSKKLGMKTIAEFVENEEILKIVKELGIDYSQGYYFSAPKSKL